MAVDPAIFGMILAAVIAFVEVLHDQLPVGPGGIAQARGDARTRKAMLPQDGPHLLFGGGEVPGVVGEGAEDEALDHMGPHRTKAQRHRVNISRQIPRTAQLSLEGKRPGMVRTDDAASVPVGLAQARAAMGAYIVESADAL